MSVHSGTVSSTRVAYMLQIQLGLLADGGIGIERVLDTLPQRGDVHGGRRCAVWGCGAVRARGQAARGLERQGAAKAGAIGGDAVRCGACRWGRRGAGLGEKLKRAAVRPIVWYPLGPFGVCSGYTQQNSTGEERWRGCKFSCAMAALSPMRLKRMAPFFTAICQSLALHLSRRPRLWRRANKYNTRSGLSTRSLRASAEAPDCRCTCPRRQEPSNRERAISSPALPEKQGFARPCVACLASPSTVPIVPILSPCVRP